MTRRAILLRALAGLLASSCGQPTPSPAEALRDNGAAQVADERAAESAVADHVMLTRLAREVDDLHVEVDRLKASREALHGELLEARLQALERTTQPSAQPMAEAAAEPTPTARPKLSRTPPTPRRTGASN